MKTGGWTFAAVAFCFLAAYAIMATNFLSANNSTVEAIESSGGRITKMEADGPRWSIEASLAPEAFLRLTKKMEWSPVSRVVQAPEDLPVLALLFPLVIVPGVNVQHFRSLHRQDNLTEGIYIEDASRLYFLTTNR